MKDITENFGTLYYPKTVLVFYKADSEGTYVECYDMDRNGNPINAHPLTERETRQLVKALNTTKEKKEPILKPDGILGANILHLDAVCSKVVWFTKERKRDMYFTDGLGIPNGRASVPPMVWIANRNSLSVFALTVIRRPTEKTRLYAAPFFNVYRNGNVCMGIVDVRIKRSASLEEFTTIWEDYFFNSYFSHLMEGYNPIKGNCVSLWERLITTGEDFPKDLLIKNGVTLKALLT